MSDLTQPPDLRARFIELAKEQLGKPYVWNADGPDTFDCSGLVCWLLKELFVSNWGATHNCQKLWDELVPTKNPKPGDLAFYGLRGKHAVKCSHVMIHVGDGRVIGACGGNRDVTSVQAAIAKGARVQFKTSKDYRPDFIGYRVAPLDPKESVS